MSVAAAPPAPPVRAAAWTVVCFLLLPIAVVFPVSVTDQDFLALPVDGISFAHYANLFTSRDWLASGAQSLVIATIAMAVSVVAGTLCSVGCWRLGGRASDTLRAAMLVPLIVPPIVYVLGYYRLLVDLRLLGTYTGVIIAHAVTGLPYVVILVSSALAGFDLRLEQAARSLGAGLVQTIRLVVLPNIRGAVASAAIFAFIHSWDELLMVLFIGGRAIFTLPRRIWDGINDKLDPTMAAVAAVLLVLTAVLLGLDLLVRRREA